MGAFVLGINCYMRMVNGSTSFPPLRFCFVNVDGVMGKTRGAAIDALPGDIMVLTETHLTTELLRVVGQSFHGFRCFWGAPASGKTGVGFLLRKTAVWAASPLSWAASSPCFREFLSGRLHGLSVHVGNGHKQMLVYGIYGISGSRWNAGQRKHTRSILEAVLADAAVRGLPAMVGGDFNLEISDSDLLQRLPVLGWTSLAQHVGLQDSHTCFRNGASCIDHVYVNNLLLPTFAGFSLGSRQGLADHLPLHCKVGWGVSPQTVFRNRDYGVPPLDHDTVQVSCSLSRLGHGFTTALRHGEVELAYRLWSSNAEAFLQNVWHQLDDTRGFRRGRGTVRVDNYALWPHCRDGGAVSVDSRRLRRHVCRMIEVQKRPFGQTAVRTWRNAQSAVELLQGADRDDACRLLSGRCSAESALCIQGILERAISQLQVAAKRRRLQQWKRQLQDSVKAQHAWLRQSTPHMFSLCFKGRDGRETANVVEQFAAVRQAWAGYRSFSGR